MKTIKITRVETALDMIPVWEELGQLMDQVSRRAYELFTERGCEHGSDIDDWLNAEKQILGTPVAESLKVRSAP